MFDYSIIMSSFVCGGAIISSIMAAIATHTTSSQMPIPHHHIPNPINSRLIAAYAPVSSEILYAKDAR